MTIAQVHWSDDADRCFCHRSRVARHLDSGQAAVEAALTLPLTLFLILGCLQLFMMLQGRILAHYALARATRAGSVDHANCTTMSQVALAALLPSFARTDSPVALGRAFQQRREGLFNPASDGGRNEAIFWLTRVRPASPPALEEEEFDLQGRPAVRVLEMELVFWYPLRIPFANWVIAILTAAQYGLRDLDGANPLMMTEKNPDWRMSKSMAAAYGGDVRGELLARTDAEHYALPIKTTYAMHMLTPVRNAPGRCPLPIPVLP